jgi:hypothetical protein
MATGSNLKKKNEQKRATAKTLRSEQGRGVKKRKKTVCLQSGSWRVAEMKSEKQVGAELSGFIGNGKEFGYDSKCKRKSICSFKQGRDGL